jgi:hypothetical protein
MPVRLYRHKDADFQNILHGESLDAVMKRTILTRLHDGFPGGETFYAVLLHDECAPQRRSPVPDVVILSEHGIGMMNLCHEAGAIFRSEDVWYADGTVVRGNIHLSARNPHEHVQLCAEHIRHHLMEPPRDGAPWLAGRYLTWQDLMFDTAVCFTNPRANFQHIERGEQIKAWERFAAFEVQGLPHWIAHLAFEQNVEDRGSVQSYRLPKRNIDRMLSELFAAVELEYVAESHLPPAQPYGYLLLKQRDDIVARFILDHETMTVGREPSCDVILPRQYRMVSRIHANLICSSAGVTIQDLSRNGIFIEGHRIQQSTPILPGQHILLGGSLPIDGVCHLEFSTNPALA